MRRGFYGFTAGALALILTACGFNSNPNEEKSGTENVTEENMECYVYRSGSSSLSEGFIIYEYKGEFIFAADYFNCGDELVETYSLQEREVKLFLEEADAIFAEGTEGETKEEDFDRAGAYSERSYMVVDGVFYSVEKIDFEVLGIDVTDAHEVEYPLDEETAEYEIEELSKLQETTQWEEQPVFITVGEFQRCVGKQIEERTGEEIERMAIDGLGDEDFMIKAEMQNGECYAVTVTYSGYVVKTEKE